jgi:hypothetical protein
MQLTTEEISQYRAQLAQWEAAMRALVSIEESEGDLEDAATSLAIEVGQQPDRVDWLDGLAKRCRVAICQADFRADLRENQLAGAVSFLLESKLCPPLLVTPLVIYVVKRGIDDFCEPLSYKLL